MIQDIPPPSFEEVSHVSPSQKPSPVLAALLHDLEVCTSSLLTIPDGIKTIPMIEQLNEGALIDYDPDTGTLFHQRVSFKVLKGSNTEISQGPVVSIGSDTLGREIISLDPQNSPLLESKYQELLSHLRKECEEKPSVEFILNLVSTFVREDVFHPDLCSEKGVEVFVARWQRASGRTKEDFAVSHNKRLIPVIPIDDFILQKVGLCRHQSLVTGYLLDKLSKEDSGFLPKGICFHVRDVVQVGEITGGHAWNLFVSKDGEDAWHVDPLWGLVKDVQNEEDIQFLHEAYGKDAIVREKERFLKKCP